MKFGAIDVIEFPDAFIFLCAHKPAGPTRGTAFDHIGFAVPNVPAMATKLAAAGISGNHRAGTEAGGATTSGIGHVGSVWPPCVFSRP
jgi:hypothetical protein